MARKDISRRTLTGTGAAALPAAGLAAQQDRAETSASGPSHGGRDLPPRTDVVLRGGYVLTMDPALGDLPDGDVLVRNGTVAAVGHRLPAAHAREIDARGTIVLPGLVDTHWHMWTALYRSMASSAPQNAYFTLNLRNGAAFEPDDIYQGVRLALTDALSSGITTVHDWAHNIRGPEYADADLRAHVEVGLRGRFSYGPPQGTPADRTIDLSDLERVQREWFTNGRAELLRLGVAGRPPGLVLPEVYRPEFEAARRLGLPISYHVASTPEQQAQDMIRRLDAEGMLGPDTQLIHAIWAARVDRALIAAAGSPVSVSPWSELLIGFGVPPVWDLVADGVPVSLSVDTLPLTGTAEMFSVMRLVLGLARGQAGQEFALPARRVLEMATVEGARLLGLGEVTGSLTPGKRADVIMVRTDAVDIAPFTDPVNMVVLAAQPQNVDTVLVDGRILKRDGRLTALDPERVVREASGALTRVLGRVANG